MLKIFAFIPIIFFFSSCILRNYDSALLEEHYQPPVITLTSAVSTNTAGSYQLKFSVHDISGLAWFSVSNKSGIYKKEFPAETISDTFLSNYTYSTIGKRYIQIKAMDSIGKESSALVVINVNIDAPTLNILQPAGKILSNTTTYDLSGTAWDVSNHSLLSLQIFTNDSAVTLSLGSSSNWNYQWNGLSEGTNSFFVRAISDSLNTNTSTIYSIVVDTTAPTFTFNNLTNNSELRRGDPIRVLSYDRYSGVYFVDVCTNGSYFERRYNPASEEYFYPTLSYGSNTISILGEDNLHQVASTNQISIVVVAYPSIWNDFSQTNQNTFTLSGAANIDSSFKIVGVKVAIDSGSFSLATFSTNSYTSWSYSISSISEGVHQIILNALADNGQVTLNTNTFTIDLTSPTLSISQPSNNQEIFSNGYTISGTAGDALSGVSYVYFSTNGSSYNTLFTSGNNWSSTLSNIGYGTVTNLVFAMDMAGNTTPTNTLVVIRPATPFLSNISPINGIFTNTQNIIYTWNAGIAGNFTVTNVTVSTNGSSPVSISPISSYGSTSYSDRTNVIRIFLAADSGKTATYILTNYIDTLPPTLSITNPTNNTIVTNDYTLIGTVSDNFSGVSNVFVSINDQGFLSATLTGNGWSYPVIITSYGVYTNKVFAIDKIGNTTTTQTLFVERKAAPTLTINDPQAVFYTAVGNIAVNYSFDIQGPYFVTNLNVMRNGISVVEQTLLQKTANNVSTASFSLNTGTNTIITTIFADSGIDATSTNIVIYDSDAPVISVSSPVANTSVTNLFSFSGTASDFSGVRRLTFLTNAGVWMTLSNTNNWSLTPILIHTNHLGIISEDVLSNITTNWISNLNVVDIPQGSVYVASWGQSNWSGSIYFPLNDLQTSVQTAVDLGLNTIKAEAATTTPGNGLNTNSISDLFSGLLITNNNLTLSGGWDSNFITNTEQTVFDGQASLKHGITIKNATNITLEHITLINNYENGTLVTNQIGAGLLLDNVSSITLFNLLVSNNLIESNGIGAGIGIKDSDHVIITNCLISSNNTPTGGKGGGIAVLQSESISIDQVTIDNNTADIAGGGILLQTVTNVWINSTITNNRSYSNGGGISLVESTNVLLSSLFVYNTATFSGGGLYAISNNGLYIENSLFGSNIALSNFGGGAVIHQGGLSFISNSTFTKNNANNNGSGLALFNTGFGVVVDNFFTNQYGQSAILLHKDIAMTVSLSNNLIGMDGSSSTYGIYEDDQNGGLNIYNTSLVDNTFLTNTLEFFLYDVNQQDVPDINTVNSNLLIQASEARGNKENFQ